jgi:hypothetical protein
VLAKLREVIRHQAQIISACVIVRQGFAASIKEQPFKFSLAQIRNEWTFWTASLPLLMTPRNFAVLRLLLWRLVGERIFSG